MEDTTESATGFGWIKRFYPKQPQIAPSYFVLHAEKRLILTNEDTFLWNAFDARTILVLIQEAVLRHPIPCKRPRENQGKEVLTFGWPSLTYVIYFHEFPCQIVIDIRHPEDSVSLVNLLQVPVVHHSWHNFLCPSCACQSKKVTHLN